MPSDHEIANVLKEHETQALAAFNDLDMRSDSADYAAMVIIRDKIAACGLLSMSEAGELAASIPIDITVTLKPRHITTLACIFADMVVMTIELMFEDCFDFAAVKARVSRMEFEIEG